MRCETDLCVLTSSEFHKMWSEVFSQRANSAIYGAVILAASEFRNIRSEYFSQRVKSTIFGANNSRSVRIPQYMERIILAACEFRNIRSEISRSERNPQYMERSFLATSEFRNIWSEKLMQRANSTTCGAKFSCGERISSALKAFLRAYQV